MQTTLDNKLSDAPNDGKQYARQSQTWAEVDGLPAQSGHSGKSLVTDGTTASWEMVIPPQGPVEASPDDGKLYFRHDGTWVAVEDTYPDYTPVGMLALWEGASIPSGWLACDGSAVNEMTYPDLYKIHTTLPTHTSEFATVIIKAIAGPNLISQIAVPQRSVIAALAGDQNFNHIYETGKPVSLYQNGIKLIEGIDFTAKYKPRRSGADIRKYWQWWSGWNERYFLPR